MRNLRCLPGFWIRLWLSHIMFWYFFRMQEFSIMKTVLTSQTLKSLTVRLGTITVSWKLLASVPFVWQAAVSFFKLISEQNRIFCIDAPKWVIFYLAEVHPFTLMVYWRAFKTELHSNLTLFISQVSYYQNQI